MPSTSPGRAARDVYDRESERSGTTCTSRSATVVLPVPDGAETTNRSPRRPDPGSRPPDPGSRPPNPGRFSPSLDSLNLLAHLLEFGLERDDDLGDGWTLGL